jgi:hypothetical protein
MNGQPWYCVILVGSHRQLYLGHSDDDAAEQLEPGTCFGTGVTAEDAQLAARRAAISVKSETRRRFIEEPRGKYHGPRNMATKHDGM